MPKGIPGCSVSGQGATLGGDAQSIPSSRAHEHPELVVTLPHFPVPSHSFAFLGEKHDGPEGSPPPAPSAGHGNYPK